MKELIEKLEELKNSLQSRNNNSCIFFEIGKIPDNIPFITREAPGFGNNAGGAIEVVVPSKTIKLESFNTVKFE